MRRTGIVMIGLALAILMIPRVSPMGSEPPGVELSLGPSAVIRILNSAAPFRFRLGVGVIAEVLTCENPWDLTLMDQKIRFRIRCRGKPIPILVELEPEVALVRNRESGLYEGVLSSLPVEIPGLGRVDLKQYVPRMEIPEVFRREVVLADRPRIIEIRLQEIRIQSGRVSVAADIRFLPERIPSAAAGVSPRPPG